MAELARELLAFILEDEDEEARADHLHLLSAVLQQVPEAAPASLTLIVSTHYGRATDREPAIRVTERVRLAVGSVDVFGRDQTLYEMKLEKDDGRNPFKISRVKGKMRGFWNQQQMQNGKRIRFGRIPVKGRRPLFLVA